MDTTSQGPLVAKGRKKAVGMIATLTFTAALIAGDQVVFAILLSNLLDHMSASLADRMAGILTPIIESSDIAAVIEKLYMSGTYSIWVRELY